MILYIKIALLFGFLLSPPTGFANTSESQTIGEDPLIDNRVFTSESAAAGACTVDPRPRPGEPNPPYQYGCVPDDACLATHGITKNSREHYALFEDRPTTAFLVGRSRPYPFSCKICNERETVVTRVCSCKTKQEVANDQ